MTKARRKKYLDETIRLGDSLLPQGHEKIAIKARIYAPDPADENDGEARGAPPEHLSINIIKGRSKSLCEIAVSRLSGQILVQIWDEARIRDTEAGTRSITDHIAIVAVGDITGATPPIEQHIKSTDYSAHLPTILKVKLEIDPDDEDAAIEAAEEFGDITDFLGLPSNEDDDLEFHLQACTGPDHEYFAIELANAIFADIDDDDAWIEISDTDHDHVVYRFGKMAHSHLFDDDDFDDDDDFLDEEDDDQEPPTDIEIGVMLQELELAFLSENPKRSPAGDGSPVRSPIEEVMASSPTGAEKLSEHAVKTAMRATALLRDNPAAARAEFLGLLASSYNVLKFRE